MQLDDLYRRLQESEAKRAALVVELHQARLASRPATTSPRGPPAAATEGAADNAVLCEVELREQVRSLEQRLEASEAARAQMLLERHHGSPTMGNGPATSNAGGGLGLEAPTESGWSSSDEVDDADEEEDAREHAQHVMSELMRALHALRRTGAQLQESRTRAAALERDLAASHAREAQLNSLLVEYQSVFPTAVALTSPSSGVTRSSNAATGRTQGAGDGSPAAELGVVATDPAGATLQAAKMHLLARRLSEMSEENAELRRELETTMRSGGSAVTASNGAERRPRHSRDW